jgi:hypothetical protein
MNHDERESAANQHTKLSKLNTLRGRQHTMRVGHVQESNQHETINEHETMEHIHTYADMSA